MMPTTEPNSDGRNMPIVDALLNDPEINFLADLFLARYEIADARRYRYFKNAVVLFSRGKWDPEDIFLMLAKCADVDTEYLTAELSAALAEMPRPIHEIFNAHYVAEPYPKGAKQIAIRMADRTELEYILGFLGYAFLLLVIGDYPIYSKVIELE